MSERIEASAPGKVILMGEHAAVYGMPAVVAAIDRRAHVELTSASSGVELDLPDVNYQRGTNWSEILGYRERKLGEWMEFRHERRRSFDVVRGDDPAHVAKLALGEAAWSVVGEDRSRLLPIRLAVRSDIPVGAGFGSSAAVAVAVVAATLRFFGGEAAPERVANLAMEVERRQHGRPSGIDHRTVLAGGVLFFAGGSARSFDVGGWVPESFALFDTGTPRESTGEVVASVRGVRERDEAAFDADLELMGDCVVRFKDLLSAESADENAIRAVVGRFESWMEQLGVVPLSVRRRIEQLPALGAAGKVSGAGTLSGEGAGCLVVFRSRDLSGDVERVLADFLPVEGSIGADGLVVEEVV
jgi:mevalonate kinase